MSKSRIPAAACFLVLSFPAAFGQTPTRPAFEVATVKPGNSESHLLRTRISPGGLLRAENATLRVLIEDAYQLKPFQLAGGPGWINSATFEIVARGEPSATDEQIRRMLQSLLEERFHLVLRRETKNAPVYELMVVKGYTRFEPANEGEQERVVFQPATAHFEYRGTTMARLADILSRQMAHLVVDRTGLSGAFDFQLDGTRDENSFAPPLAPLLPQIGLQLESRKAPVDYFVIERAEKPSEN